MSQDFTRRTFLGGAAAAALAGMAKGQPTLPLIQTKRHAKNIIWCVSDGMSAGVPSMLDHYLQNTFGRTSVWRQLNQDRQTVHGLMDTRSLSSMVTDSAAASSAWGSGTHVINGAINTLPGVGELTPLYQLLGKDGMKRGLVTTTTITHATPSGFAIATKSRSAEPTIARLYREVGVEVLMGGGQPFFSADKRTDKVDVYGEYAKDGYQVCKTRDELLKASPKGKLLGVFSEGQLPYSIDRLNTPSLMETVPTLAEMTKTALNLLKGSKDGFILQIEGGRVDHAAHANDLGAIINDQLAFEEAVALALEFAREDGETLVVVTSDHGNANPGITGFAEMGAGNGLNKVAGMKSSYEAMSSDLKAAKDAKSVQDLVEAKLGLKFTTEQAQAVVDAAGDKSPLAPFGNYRFPTAAIALACGSHTGVGWTSGSHTSDYTILSAWGVGSELFAGVVQNTDCFAKILSLRGIKHTNPSMTLEEARAAEAKEKSGGLSASLQEEAHWF